MSKNAVMPLSDYVAACDKVREKTGTTDLIKSGELPEKVDAVYEKGKDAEWNKFWDAYQSNGTRRKYGYAFYGREWNDITFKPKYDIIIEGTDSLSGFAVFANSNITDLAGICEAQGITIDATNFKIAASQDWFNACYYLTRTPPLPVTDSFEYGYFYAYCISLHTVQGFYVSENTIFKANTFTACNELQNLTIIGTIGQSGLDLHWSEKLTHASLMNVINCLMAYTVAEGLVLPNTSGSVVLSNAKLIEGKNYLMEFRSYEFNGASSPLYVGSQNMTASKVNIEGVGERIGVWRECDFWADPDIYWYRVCVYQDGDDIKELRYRINKQTGEVIPHAYAGDILSLKVDQTETHSVTLGASNLAKLTDTEKAIATQKGWSLA